MLLGRVIVVVKVWGDKLHGHRIRVSENADVSDIALALVQLEVARNRLLELYEKIRPEVRMGDDQ